MNLIIEKVITRFSFEKWIKDCESMLFESSLYINFIS